MKCAMNYKQEEKYDLVHGLCKLFSEIDINGDGKMEWREFTQYVIDAVMQNPIKKNMRGELPNQQDLLEQAHSQKSSITASTKDSSKSASSIPPSTSCSWSRVAVISSSSSLPT